MTVGDLVKQLSIYDPEEEIALLEEHWDSDYGDYEARIYEEITIDRVSVGYLRTLRLRGKALPDHTVYTYAVKPEKEPDEKKTAGII